jgi:hypothetical protein
MTGQISFKGYVFYEYQTNWSAITVAKSRAKTYTFTVVFVMFASQCRWRPKIVEGSISRFKEKH